MIIEYKQKVIGVDYNNILKFLFTLSEQDDIYNGIIFCINKKFQKLDIKHLEDLANYVIRPKTNKIRFENDNTIYYSENFMLEIPREFLRYLVYSIGEMSYDSSQKGETSILFQKILNKLNFKIENQLSNEDKWFIRNW